MAEWQITITHVSDSFLQAALVRAHEGGLQNVTARAYLLLAQCCYAIPWPLNGSQVLPIIQR